MVPFETFFTLVVGSLALNLLLAVAFIAAGSAFVRKVIVSRDEAARLREKAVREAKRMLEDAERTARSIREQALGDASLLASDAKRLCSEFDERMNTALDALVKEAKQSLVRSTGAFEETLGAVVKERAASWRSGIADLLHTVEKTVREDGEHFHEVIDAESRRYRESITRMLEESKSRAEAEVEAYKRDAKARIDEAAKATLQRVAVAVLGGAIDLKAHESLILHAIEDAKEAGMFATRDTQ